MIGLTKRQQAIIDYIKVYMAENFMSPSISEIAAAFDMKPPSALMHLRSLQKKGILVRTSKARSIVLKDQQGGRTAASKPAAAPTQVRTVPTVQSLDDLATFRAKGTLPKSSIDPQLISSSNYAHLFAYVMPDQTLAQFGIFKGDTLYVREDSQPEMNGFSLISGEGTLFVCLNRPDRDGKIRYYCDSDLPLALPRDAEIIGTLIGLSRVFLSPDEKDA